MLRVLFLRLDDTLLDSQRQAYPYAADATRALAAFDNEAGDALDVALLAATPPRAGGESVDELLGQVIETLDEQGLLPVFEPADERITLSAHAGDAFPSRRMFLAALERLGVAAKLNECGVICHGESEAAACRALGLEVLRFDPDDPEADFSQWATAPLLVARGLCPAEENLERALGVLLRQRADIETCRIESRRSDGTVRLSARRWCPLEGPELGGLDGVYVPLPVRVDVTLDDDSGVQVNAGQPDRAAVKEARLFVASLGRAGRVAESGGDPPRGTTHQVEVDDQGRRRLTRTRMSAR